MTAATETRTPLLNQIIAVRAGIKNDVEKQLTELHHKLLKGGVLLQGHARTYTPADDDGFRYPAEGNQVQVKVEWALRQITEELTKLFDVTAQLDWTNQHARADVVLFSGETDAVTLLSDVPVSYLLFLEKQLVNLETFIRKLPTLDPSERWEFDPNLDVHRTAPVGTVKTKKVMRNHVKAEATDRHPAQVETYYEDVPIGTWSTVKFSGALPAARVNAMLMRVTTLAAAVKFAREQANLEGVMQVNPGRRVLEYIFAG
jgi:hypothetical protein